MKMNKIICSMLLVFAFAFVAFADEVPPPTPKKTPKPKSVEATMTIRLDKNAKTAVLKLSKTQLKNLRAQIEDVDGDFSDATAENSLLRTQTIVGGMFLSLAFVFGGVLFMRSNKTNEKITKTIAAGAVLFAFASAATFVFANAGPPAELRSITGKLFDKKVFGYWNQAGGAIKIEVLETGENVELIVPDKAEENKKDEE